MRQIIRTGMALVGSSLDQLCQASLVIEDGRIIEVVSGAIGKGSEVTHDFSDAVVMPGLIDTHVHLQLTPLDDHAVGRQRFEDDRRSGLLELTALRHAQLALAAGITTLRDCGADMSILSVRRAIESGHVGPRLLVAGSPITTTSGHCHWFGLRADNADEIRRSARWLAEQGVDVLKIISSGGNMTPGSNALAPQYSVEELSIAASEAHRLGRRIVAHALNVEAIRRCVESGVDSIDHCAWQTVDGSLRYDKELGELLISHGSRVGITGSGILRVLLEHGSSGIEELRHTLDAHRQLYLSGAKVNVHSDAGVRFTHFERFDLSMKVMMYGLDISPLETLAAVTAVSAEALGLENELGAIEVGKRADLLVLDRDPLQDIDNIRAVRAVLRDGMTLVDRGRLVLMQS